MKTVNTHAAKAQFSRPLKRVALGEQITIASRGTAVARLVPIAKKILAVVWGCSGASSSYRLTLMPRYRTTF